MFYYKIKKWRCCWNLLLHTGYTSQHNNTMYLWFSNVIINQWEHLRLDVATDDVGVLFRNKDQNIATWHSFTEILHIMTSVLLNIIGSFNLLNNHIVLLVCIPTVFITLSWWATRLTGSWLIKKKLAQLCLVKKVKIIWSLVCGKIAMHKNSLIFLTRRKWLIFWSCLIEPFTFYTKTCFWQFYFKFGSFEISVDDY